MKSHWLSLVTVVALWALPSAVESAEQHLQFLEGMRDKNYYDYALFYLDQLQADPGTPSEIRTHTSYSP